MRTSNWCAGAATAAAATAMPMGGVVTGAARKRVSMRTGKSKNGELSLSSATFCCGVLKLAKAAVA